jgi:hypothetical protein
VRSCLSTQATGESGLAGCTDPRIRCGPQTPLARHPGVLPAICRGPYPCWPLLLPRPLAPPCWPISCWPQRPRPPAGRIWSRSGIAGISWRQTHPDDPQQKVDEGEEGGGWGSRERPSEAASPNNVRRALEQQAGACWGRWSPWTSGKFARATHVGALDAPLKVPCPACPWAHPLALLP